MKRPLIPLVVFLLLGAIVNVAVAWGFARSAPMHGRKVAIGSRIGGAASAWIIAERCEGQACIRNRFNFEADEDFTLDTDGQNLKWTLTVRSCTSNESRESVTLYPLYEKDCWSRLGSADSESALVLEEVGAGWPFVACWGALAYASNEKRDRQSYAVIALGPLVRHSGGIQYADFGLPLMPTWPGFAINTVFYAVILWVLFAAPFALRRRRRIRRGLCPACAYPVGDSPVCTECGKAVVKQKAQKQKAEMT